MTAGDTTERAALWAAYSTAGDAWERSRPPAELESAILLARIRQENTAPVSLFVKETRN